MRFHTVAAAISLAMVTPALAAEPLKVVASFSILGDLVAEVGGDRVSVHTIVGPNGDAHVYEPTPQDARETASADLVVVNGLGFEGWIDRLITASGYAGTVAVASKGVTPRAFAAGDVHEETGHGDHDAAADGNPPEGLHEHSGGVDPHAWQSVANAEMYVANIRSALCAADPADCPAFEANAARYLGELKSLDASIRAGFAAIPTDRRFVITTHDAFGYFAAAYNVTFMAPQGVSTDAEASAADVARLIEQIRGHGVRAIFLENISDPRLMQQIARETGVEPGGELYSDALSAPDGPAGTYIAMMRNNAALLQSAMAGS